MKGVLYLCNAPDSKYKWMNFLRLDYKNAYTPIPTVEDICQTLPNNSDKIIKKKYIYTECESVDTFSKKCHR